MTPSAISGAGTSGGTLDVQPLERALRSREHCVDAFARPRVGLDEEGTAIDELDRLPVFGHVRDNHGSALGPETKRHGATDAGRRP